jgi:hypothetical protein
MVEINSAAYIMAMDI